MKKKTTIYSALAIAVFLIGSAFMMATSWGVAQGAKARFTIDGTLGVDVSGTLDFTKSTIIFDPEDPEKASMAVTLSVASINTGIDKRDNHLRSADFFEAATYPEITFRSTVVKKTGANSYSVTGKLTIKKTTKEDTIPFTFTKGADDKGMFEGKFNISRIGYGVGGKRGNMGDEVRIDLKVPVIPQ